MEVQRVLRSIPESYHQVDGGYNTSTESNKQKIKSGLKTHNTTIKSKPVGAVATLKANKTVKYNIELRIWENGCLPRLLQPY